MEKKATCGAVLFSPRTTGPKFFGIEIPGELTKRWLSQGTTHAVAQSELLPIVLARATWTAELENAWVLHFIDNDSVKAALVSGHTAALASVELLMEAASLEMSLRCFSWYARVPSPSNIADAPSRLSFDEIKRFWMASQSEVVWPSSLSVLGLA